MSSHTNKTGAELRGVFNEFNDVNDELIAAYSVLSEFTEHTEDLSLKLECEMLGVKVCEFGMSIGLVMKAISRYLDLGNGDESLNGNQFIEKTLKMAPSAISGMRDKKNQFLNDIQKIIGSPEEFRKIREEVYH